MLTFKKATSEDTQLINELATIAFPATYGPMLSQDQIEYMMEWMYSVSNITKQIEEDGHVYYIAYENNVPCGYLSVQPEDTDIYHLQKIYLLPEFQGKGYGSVLFEKAVEHIKEIHPGKCEMHLNLNRDNKKAHEFYKRKGMYQIGEGDFDIGRGYLMTDYIMCLDIE